MIPKISLPEQLTNYQQFELLEQHFKIAAKEFLLTRGLDEEDRKRVQARNIVNAILDAALEVMPELGWNGKT